MICPIGLPDLGSKAPAVIAAGICVQLLQHRAALAANRFRSAAYRDICVGLKSRQIIPDSDDLPRVQQVLRVQARFTVAISAKATGSL